MNTSIVCFGNPLRENDGAGYFIYRRLARKIDNENIHLREAGTSAIRNLDAFDADRVVVVDAMEASSSIPEGSVRIYYLPGDHKAEFDSMGRPAGSFGAEELFNPVTDHDQKLEEFLYSLPVLVGRPVPVIAVCIAIHPGENVKISLSSVVRRGCHSVIEMLLDIDSFWKLQTIS